MPVSNRLAATVIAVALVGSGPDGTFAPIEAAAADDVTAAEALELYERKKWSRAFKALLPLAADGHPLAMRLVGEMYLYGEGTVADEEKGLHWMEQAADAGFPREANYIAGRYLARWQHDWNRAAPYVQRAAALGHPEAQAMLADMYGIGRGVPRDPEEARRWSRLAAEKTDNSWTVYRAARSYLDDPDGRDASEGLKLLRRAAEMGHGLAQDDLGGIYMDGAIAPVDFDEAQKWLVLAVRQGVPTAHMRLAKIYLLQGQPNNALSCWVDAWKAARETENEALLREVYQWYVVLGLIGLTTGPDGYPAEVLERDKSPKGECKSEGEDFIFVLLDQFFEDLGGSAGR